ncbi:MAG: hypothetical protein ACKVQW_05045 [Pyrinomonadaceae bacterium]
MKTKIISLVFTLAVATALVLGGEYIYASWFVTASPVNAESTVPDYVLYDSLFRMDLSFRRKALEQQLTGQPVTSLQHYFKNSANLTDEENEVLRLTAIEFLEEIEPIDTRARQLTAEIREQYLYGEVPAGGEVAPPPAELGDLQDRRNEIVLQKREKLSELLGKDAFEKLDKFMHKEFAENFQANGEPLSR